MEPRPTFLIIGAAKSGTTSLYQYVKQHPDVFMSENKEPKFFAFENSSLDFRGPRRGISQIRRSTITDYKSYLELFRHAQACKAVGEASPVYLHYPGAAQRIKKYIPDVKLIAILRNPVERLYSDWKHQLRMGWEPEKNFLAAVEKSTERERENWIPYLNYTDKGFYYRHISTYLRYFTPDQLKIFLYEELSRDAGRVVQEAFRFLGVEHTVPVDTRIQHMKGEPVARSSFFERFLRPVRNLLVHIDRRCSSDSVVSHAVAHLNRIPDAIPNEARKKLVEVYRPDIILLQDLLNRDLSAWLQEP